LRQKRLWRNRNQNIARHQQMQTGQRDHGRVPNRLGPRQRGAARRYAAKVSGISWSFRGRQLLNSLRQVASVIQVNQVNQFKPNITRRMPAEHINTGCLGHAAFVVGNGASECIWSPSLVGRGCVGPVKVSVLATNGRRLVRPTQSVSSITASACVRATVDVRGNRQSGRSGGSDAPERGLTAGRGDHLTDHLPGRP
jgi:hypothetical protein